MPHFYIDGYNLLFALPEMPAGTWMEKRHALLLWISDYRPQGQNPVTVVFDSRQGLGDREVVSGLDVVYTAGETADDWIIKRVRQISNPRAAIVITDDQGIRHMIRGTGARWQSAHDFIGLAQKPRTPDRRRAEHLDQITEELRRNYGL